MQCISDVDISAGTRVFVRGDLDVAIESNEVSFDTYRLDKMLPTLSFLKSKESKIVIAGHMGRPGGKFDSKLSTKQLLPYFNNFLGEGNFKLLENLRFDPREELNDTSFTKELASKADIYVNECFSTCTRNHASFTGMPKLLPAYAGVRLMEETQNLSRVLNNPGKPVVIVIGGAKIESKLSVINFFSRSADYILLGGKIGNEYSKTGKNYTNILTPSDYIDGGLDIGLNTIKKYVEIIKTAKTIVWAGPLGKFENPKYLEGTKEIVFAIVLATKNNNAFSLAGGGDTVSACDALGLPDKFSFVSTGGSAMLQFLTGEKLPGLEALGYYA